MSNRRLLPFIYSADIAYLIELGNEYARFYYDDQLITATASPYTKEEIFHIQTAQIADVVRITSTGKHTQKLMRTAVDTFVFEPIDFNYGPFLLRNDLFDLFDTNPTEMQCSVTAVGSVGTLIAESAVFDMKHIGALFRLTHPRTNSIISVTGSMTISQMQALTLKVKGNASLITRGTWTGTAIFQRNVNGAGWENFRTYKSNNDRNASLSWVEEDDNVLYRITREGSISSGFHAELNCNETYDSGIVRVIGYGGPTATVVEVVTELVSTSKTRRWAEGAWSDFRGWPVAVTFFEDRCVYAGAIAESLRAAGAELMYPALREISQ